VFKCLMTTSLNNLLPGYFLNDLPRVQNLDAHHVGLVSGRGFQFTTWRKQLKCSLQKHGNLSYKG
jgi:hypothetical protein